MRERREDIPLLANHFIREFSARTGRQVDRIDPRALERLTSYDWPGNVRELANVLERAVILCSGPVLQPAHLAWPASTPASDDLCTLEEAERRHILKALERTGRRAGWLARRGGDSRPQPVHALVPDAKARYSRQRLTRCSS